MQYLLQLRTVFFFHAKRRFRRPYPRLPWVYLFGLIVLAGPVGLAQTTYYVAADGNDANDGRSAASPFQTLGKVNSLNLQAGDQVLFRRGDTFRGTLTIRRSGWAGQPIGFDAYGAGAKPTLSGSVPVTGWTNLGGGVWQATCPTCGSQVTGLHRNNAALPLGRYPNFDTPNKGYLTVQSHVSNTQITSQQPIPFNLNTGWRGAEVVLRSVQWIIDRAVIDQQNGNSLTLNGQTLTYPIRDGWGYFIQNHPATLDQPGEWCFDPNTKTIRLYNPAADPNAQTITATVHRSAVDLAASSFVTLRNLHLTETLQVGLLAHNPSNLTLSHLEITRSGEDGVQMTGTGNTVVLENSRIVGANNNGVRVGSNTNGTNPDVYQNVTLRGNLIRRAGLMPGRGKGGDGHYNGLHVGADQNVLIEDNIIDSTGYNGISFWNNTLVQRNVVTNYCMAKSDGGGLYIWNGIRRAMSNIRVRFNMVYNGFGAPEGTPNGAYSGVNGIFFDDCVYNVELTGNTTFNNRGLGFFLHAVSNMTLQGNTSFGNGEGQLAITHNHGVCPPRGNVVRNNVFVSRLFEQFNVKYESDQNDLPDFGQIDSNYYVRPFEKEFVIRAVWNYGSGIRGADFNLEEWRTRFGKDVNTKASSVVHKDYRVTQVVGAPRFTSGFDADLSGWSVMLNQPGAGRVDWDNSGRLDGGSMRVSFPQPSGETWFFNSRIMTALSPGVIQGGKTYRLSFDAVATSNTKRVQAFLQTPGTPSFYFNARHQPMIGMTRQRYEVLFTPTTDLTNPQVGFQVYEDGQTIWFDNVQFEEVLTTPVSPNEVMQIVYNPTARDSVVTLNGSFRDVTGQVRTGTVTLAPLTSLVLLKDDNSTPPPPPPTPLREPENPADAVVGLDYRYYEGNWTQLPDFTALTPVKTGTASVPDVSMRNRDDFFGLRFTGYVNVPADGVYTFYSASDDGSKLFIGNTAVVNHDGTHPQTEQSGTIGLKAGKHAITVVYFENAGGEGLNVSYSGPNVDKQVIPASAFYRVGPATPPPPPPTPLRDAENPANTVAGLDYGYYEGNWSVLPNFAGLTPVRSGTASVPDLSVRSRNDNFGLRFTGYINVPTDGAYTFFTSSDDGSKLYIGSTEVVNNDGGHPIQERSGTIGLKAGKHAFTVVYFEGGGGEGLSVSYSGPNLNKQVIPASAFYRVGTVAPPPAPGSGTGLRAEYFNNRNLTGSPALTRTDATVDFDWGNGSPAAGTVPVDNYSVRWTGQVEAPATGNYTFSTVSDDGVRLWVNGNQVINNWTGHAPTTNNSPSIALTAGQRYEIRMEYFEGGGGAVARLRWSYPGQSQQAIPQIRLYPAGGGGRVGAPVASSDLETSELLVYPVPARDEVRIRYRADAAGSAVVQLLNPLGQSVLTADEPVEAGENLIRMKVGSYPRGIYVLTLTQGGRRLTHKVLLTE